MSNSDVMAASLYTGLGRSRTRHDTTSQVAETLRDAILEGLLTPGAPLREVPLAAELRVSRNTVREALRLLSAESLVQHVRNRGFVVSDIDDREIDEIYQAREAVEMVGLRLLTTDQDPATLELLRTAAAAIEKALQDKDVSTSLANDNAFHAAIAAHSGNGRLIAIHQGLQRELRLALTLAERSAYQLGRHTDDHHLILEAVASGDVARAETALREHLSAGAAELKLLRSVRQDLSRHRGGQRH